MILGKIRIRNFKSIIDSEDVYLSKSDLITILAGQNESGKTAFLRALKFFEEGAYDGFEEEDRRMRTSPRIECTYYLTNDEVEQLKSDTNNQIATFFEKNGVTFVRGDIDKDDFDEIELILPEEVQNMINEFNNASADSSDDENETEDDEKVDEQEEFDAYDYFNELRPSFVFYSSFRESILPGKIMYNEIPNNQAVQDFEKIYQVDFQYLLSASTSDQEREEEQDRIRNEAAASLNDYWNQVISGEEVEYKFSISIHNNNTNEDQGYVTFFVSQGDGPQLKISQKSHGFQWFSGFNLRLRAHQKELDENGIILLIDEPGQGLHEQAQKDVANVLEELATESKMQIIYSTHQPILLGGEDLKFSRLLLVERSKDNGSKFRTITKLITENGSKDALSPIKTALGLVSISRLPIPANKKVLIVEGVSEYFYLRTLFGADFVIIPSTGVDQIPNILSILYGWGVNAKVLLDDDRQGRAVFNKIKKEFFANGELDGIDKMVLKIPEATGIEDLLSEGIIKNIMSNFNKEYDNKKSKIENVKEIGKIIFAKTFFDQFNENLAGIDKETIENFKQIKDFVDNN